MVEGEDSPGARFRFPNHSCTRQVGTHGSLYIVTFEENGLNERRKYQNASEYMHSEPFYVKNLAV